VTLHARTGVIQVEFKMLTL